MSIFPQLGQFKEFWCQKVLPLVYDDSLSFYEVLCRIKAKLNEVIENLNEQGKYIETQLPILVDETVRKYFNQNQNLPFIDCYAHGITEKLDDIGPALQALVTKYGASFGYYMKGSTIYKLGSEVVFPQYTTVRCDGLIYMNFQGSIGLSGFTTHYYKQIHGTSEQVKPFSTGPGSTIQTNVEVDILDHVEDIFSVCELRESKFKINFFAGNYLLNKNITAFENVFFEVSQIYPQAAGDILQLGMQTVSKSSIIIHGGTFCDLTIGNFNKVDLEFAINTLSCANNNRITCSYYVKQEVNCGADTVIQGIMRNKSGYQYNVIGLGAIGTLGGFVKFPLQPQIAYYDFAPGGNQEIDDWRVPFLGGIKQSNHRCIIPDAYFYHPFELTVRVEPGVKNYSFAANIGGNGIKTIVTFGVESVQQGWAVPSGKTYTLKFGCLFNCFYIKNETDNVIIANVENLRGYSAVYVDGFGVLDEEQASEIKNYAVEHDTTTHKMSEELGEGGIALIKGGQTYANATANTKPDSGTGD